jgi:hypothetical protein
MIIKKAATMSGRFLVDHLKKSVHAAEREDHDQDRNRHADQPQQQITSHARLLN